VLFRVSYPVKLTAWLNEPQIILKLHPFEFSSLLFSSFIGVLAKTNTLRLIINRINNNQKVNVTGS
jgi:hypothetical protein